MSYIHFSDPPLPISTHIRSRLLITQPAYKRPRRPHNHLDRSGTVARPPPRHRQLSVFVIDEVIQGGLL